MSYGLMAYSVNIDKLKESCGSGDDSLRRAISGRFKNDIASTNQQLGYSNDRGEPSVFLAIRDLIIGDERNLDRVLYAYGFKYIVEFFGKFLDNNLFYPASYDFLVEEVGANLSETGATVEMFKLLNCYLPVSFPTPDDFPLYGYWSAERVAASVEPLAAFPEKTEELKAIQKWLEFAALKGEGIVGYYH
ncbi:MAG: hypothetical protein KME17_14210 [Cyanosarcina radialis HA8281-LM2]|jgi:hypothetical protein|nr:hypothetical protein [Cyanosarcina radialis HA8281-LM2]